MLTGTAASGAALAAGGLLGFNPLLVSAQDGGNQGGDFRTGAAQDATSFHPFLNTDTAPSVSAGPFVLQEWLKDQYATFTANENFFLGRPNFDTSTVQLYGNANVVMQALYSGEIDQFGPGNENWADAQENENVETFAYNVDRANELLDDAGWEMGDDGVRAKDGERLAFQSIYGPNNDVMREQMATVAQEFWGQVGAEVEVMGMEWASGYSPRRQAGATCWRSRSISARRRHGWRSARV